MSNEKKNKYSGVASLFEKIELKTFFSNYLYFIIGIEFLIFLISFLGNIGPEKGPFPWKFYFYVSFITPVAITFLLGIFILAFNQFIFGSIIKNNENNQKNTIRENKSKLFKINLFFNYMKEAPFLPILFSIIAGTVLLYKLDAIFLFFFNAGEKMVSYILIIFGSILAIIFIFAITWLIINYSLTKKQIEEEYKYRNDIMNKVGILILPDNTIITKKGKNINNKMIKNPKIKKTNKKNNFKILPPS